MSKIDCVVTATFLRSDRVVLRKDQTHDLAQFDVVQEEVDVYRVQRILGGLVSLVLDEVFFADHLNIRIFNVDTAGATKSYRYRAIPREEGPPDAFPEALVLLT